MLAEALVALNGLDLPEPALALSVTQAERDKAKSAGNSVGDSYPINNAKQLHSAAVLAASHHGDWKAAQSLIRRRAKELGVSLDSLPGFGSSDGDSDKVAATMIALAQGPTHAGVVPMHTHEAMSHEVHHGMHSHPHVARVVVNKPHHHNGDNVHGGMINHTGAIGPHAPMY
jgi:hypothetical protein